jgi:phage terminase large subunit
MKLNSEDRLVLDQFKPRPYQEPMLDAIFNRGIKRVIVAHPRRSGKDFALFSGAAIVQCLLKPCMVAYVGINYGSIRKTVWDMVANDGVRLIDMCPPGTVARVLQAEQKIVFKNGSILHCVGADSHATSLRGTNPYAVIMSEYAYYKDGGVLDTVTPILAANGGWLAIASTPAGQNHFHHLYKIAESDPAWWTEVLTVDETRHITPEALEEDKRRMSHDLFLQEYYCSFDRGISGAIFGKEIKNLEHDGRITHVGWEPGLLVHTAWDIGLSKGNATAIVFFQIVGDGTVIRIIDAYSSEQLGLDHFANVISEKPYRYGLHLAPHDIAVREWGGGGITRFEKASRIGLNFKTIPQILLADQIENALTHIHKLWIDQNKCKGLIDALNNYYREYDEARRVYKPKPVHSWASNYASAFMTMFAGLHETYNGAPPDYYDKIRRQALYGAQGNLPNWLRNENS